MTKRNINWNVKFDKKLEIWYRRMRLPCVIASKSSEGIGATAGGSVVHEEKRERFRAAWKESSTVAQDLKVTVGHRRPHESETTETEIERGFGLY